MYDVVKIGDKEIPMLSVGAVDVFYRQIFHEDPIKLQAKDDLDAADYIELYQRMGFVMAKFVETKSKEAMLELNEDAFLDWLMDLPRKDLMEAIPHIRAIYEGETFTTAEEKKKDGESTE